MIAVLWQKRIGGISVFLQEKHLDERLASVGYSREPLPRYCIEQSDLLGFVKYEQEVRRASREFTWRRLLTQPSLPKADLKKARSGHLQEAYNHLHHYDLIPYVLRVQQNDRIAHAFSRPGIGA